MKNILAFILLPLLATNSLAKEHYVDLRDVNFKGKVVEVSSPNIFKIETTQYGSQRHFWIELINVDFGVVAGKKCQHRTLAGKIGDYVTPSFIKTDSKLQQSCKYMDDLLHEKLIQAEITDWSQPILKGYLFYDAVNVNNELIANGLYRVDYKQTRDANLAILERHARCQRLGIWKSKLGIPEEDMKCQN
ncbi:thermonuclease family protein [Microbulbifer epialgicus]|uniref:Thermonuclease family protein n=1 Tax=Microbulbifer epialgicus TaxID=393907 RepID=A0ABV4NTJ6_9GAMM